MLPFGPVGKIENSAAFHGLQNKPNRIARKAGVDKNVKMVMLGPYEKNNMDLDRIQRMGVAY